MTLLVIVMAMLLDPVTWGLAFLLTWKLRPWWGVLVVGVVIAILSEALRAQAQLLADFGDSLHLQLPVRLFQAWVAWALWRAIRKRKRSVSSVEIPKSRSEAGRHDNHKR